MITKEEALSDSKEMTVKSDEVVESEIKRKSGISRIILESIEEHHPSTVKLPDVKETTAIGINLQPFEERINQIEQKLKLMTKFAMFRDEK